jgi:hypothetical protein
LVRFLLNNTTQGIDFTKKLIATELSYAIYTMMTPNSTIANIVHNTPSQEQQQRLAQVEADNQATCNNITSATAAYSIDMTIRN